MSRIKASGPRIVVGCFRGLLEDGFAERAAGLFGVVSRTDDRATTLALAARLQPRLILLPTVDVHGHAVAPLASRCREAAPRASVVMLLTGAAEQGRGIRRAIDAGSVVTAARTVDELRSDLGQLLEPTPTPVDLERDVRTLCAGVGSALLTEALIVASHDAEHRLSVNGLAQRLRISPRTFSRHLAQTCAPSPAEIIAWGRLLRGVYLGPTQRLTDVRAEDMGFHDRRGLDRTIRRLLRTSVECRAIDRASVRAALQQRLDAMLPIRR